MNGELPRDDIESTEEALSLQRGPQRVLGQLEKEFQAHLDSYINALEELDGPTCDVRYEYELIMARSGNRVWTLLPEMSVPPSAEFPRMSLRVELALTDLKTLLDSQFERWGWLFLKESQMEPELDIRFIRHRETKEYPYLQAAITAVLGGRLRRHHGAMISAQKARTLGIEPDPNLGLDEVEDELWKRHAKWRTDSLGLSEKGELPPKLLHGELEQLRQLSEDIRPYAAEVLSTYDHAEFAYIKNKIRADTRERYNDSLLSPSFATESDFSNVEPNIRKEEPPEANLAPPGLPLLILGSRSKAPIVRGKAKERLTVPQYKVVKALHEAGEERLTKDKLVKKSGCSDAVNILKRLRKSDADWAYVIEMALKTGGGYALRRQ